MSFIFSWFLLLSFISFGLLVSNWLALVFIMEFTMFVFIFMMADSQVLSLSNPGIKYFFAQTLGSLCLLVAGLNSSFVMPNTNPMHLLLLLVGLCLKIGLFPFHFWVMPVIKELPYLMLGTVIILLKILPLSLLESCSGLLFIHYWSWMLTLTIILLSMISGLMYGLYSETLRGALGASSISHAGWFFLASLSSSLPLYFFLYSIMLTLVCGGLCFRQWQLTSLSVMGLAGLPPFTVFFGKMVVLMGFINNYISPVFVILVLLTAVFSLFYYLKFSFSLYLML
uniref:NADH-ubiquinone oxidoreductase chain 2 n=1 Tax=Fruticicola koreana TaxID=1686014 RepID=A0A3Q8AQB0_9EUPU|nr:NADH dehydrogenase subunit 2 [Fruticicola koreana]